MRETATKIKQNAQPWKSSWDALIKYANARLNKSPNAVAYLDIPGYYKKTSGHVNAKNRLQQDMWSAYSAAIVYAINAALSGTPGKDRYADQAVRILNNWAGKNKGFTNSDGPLVSSYTATGLVFAAELIYDYPGWRSGDRAQFLKWASTVLYTQANIKTRGLYTSTPYHSNWNDWGILMALAVDHLTGNNSNFQKDIGILKQLITVQIEPNGSIRSELARGSNSILYTAFALEPLTAAVTIAFNAGGPDLRYWNPPGGGTVKQALEFLFDKGVANPGQWPVSSARSNPKNKTKTNGLFAAAGRLYGMSKWQNWAKPVIPDLETGVGWAVPTLLQPTPNY